MVERIQRKRTKGWRMPADALYVGRPSRWGNPFQGILAAYRYDEAVGKARQWLPLKVTLAWVEAGGKPAMLHALASRNVSVLKPLFNKTLCCWCPVDQVCHGDVLARIVAEAMNGKPIAPPEAGEDE